ncbi:MAG: hypothetical protein A2X48_18055 [Lentisphaerae bacterium GWF2_49_21]|nr:MAG: hypothetical protein A2X48_18055 [Lentisphaerae bacterium GWF2_49_21]
MHMDCEKFEKLIPDYEWINEKDRKECEQHASICGKCGEKLNAVEILGQIVSEGDENMKNPDFTGKVMEQIKRKKSYPILPFISAFVVFETAILVFLDPKLRETVNLMLAAVGFSDEYIGVIEDFFSSSIPLSYDLSLSGFLNVEMVIVTILAGIILFSPAVRIFDERRIPK